MELNVSTMCVEGGEKRATKEKNVHYVDATPRGTIRNYFHRTYDTLAHNITSERLKMHNGEEKNS